MAYNPFDTAREPEQEERVDHAVDDLEMPEGAELDFTAMTQTIDKIAKGVDEDVEVKEPEAEGTGPTPTTPRPRMPPSKDSEAPLVPGHFSLESSGKNSGDHETDDDPDDDVLSMNTDINRHERTLSVISRQISEISNKVNMIPDLDSKVRSLTKMNSEMETRCKVLSQEIENMRKSMNMYQSSTANKIADVERRAAEKQLSVSAIKDDTLIPPSEIHSVRDERITTNRAAETIPAIAVSAKPAKKRAVIADW